MTDPATHRPVVIAERILLAVALLAKIASLFRTRELMIGYDVGDHFHRVMEADWWTPPLWGSYYGYHPPLGFAIPHYLVEWNVQEAFAVQIFSTLCAVIALLALRETLRTIGQLTNPLAVFFLYLWAGIPIIVNSGISINLDIAILACGSVSLWLSVALWKHSIRTIKGKLIAAGLVLSLICGVMVKYNGLILFAIPALTAFFFHEGPFKRLLKRILAAGAISLLAMAFVFPFYYDRYYSQTGTFFPRNNVYWYPDLVARCQEFRDANLEGFFAVLFLEGWFDFKQDPSVRHTGLMLSDTWRDFWVEDTLVYLNAREEGETSVRPSVILIGSIYRWTSTVLVLAGLAACMFKWSTEPFQRLGGVLLTVAFLHVAALAYYCYLEANPLADATKGMYVLPATWAVAFLSVQPLRFLSESFLLRLFPWTAGALGVWLAFNHLWPVY